jgi:predicted phage-related endonuclease
MNEFKNNFLCEKLSFLQKTFETWSNRIDTVTTVFQQSEGQYFLEQTLVSLLAGSAWVNNLQAITEVRVKKRTSEGKQKPGRLDLLIRDGIRCIGVEAKIVWDSEVVEKTISSYLDDACNQLKIIQEEHYSIKVGLVFFVPWWTRMAQRNEFTKTILHEVLKIKTDLMIGFYNDKLDFPGVIVFGRLA